MVNEKQYVSPPTDLLANAAPYDREESEKEAQKIGDQLVEALASFGVAVSLQSVSCGPRVTCCEIVPAPNVRVSALTNLQSEVALALNVANLRVAALPGRAAVGYEIPNKHPEAVSLRELLETAEFREKTSSTSVCLGKDAEGKPMFDDIAKMPHLLIAGACGMGKSVCIHSLLVSMFCKASPEDLKLILIDPKTVECKAYNGIPHLLMPVVTDAYAAAGALAWAVQEMERRYALFVQLSVRKIEQYNETVDADRSLGEHLPQLVIVIDELCDLMFCARKTIEPLIASLAQKARAAGIHLILTTQRPDVKVISGVIKANIPSRIAFRVVSATDSRVILDRTGAEELLDRGDMLYSPVGSSMPVRAQGAFVSDEEVRRVTDFLKAQGADYDEEAGKTIASFAEEYRKKNSGAQKAEGPSFLSDATFLKAVAYVVNEGKASTAFLQRKLYIGYAKAASYMDKMVELGIISEADGVKPRDVLISRDAPLFEILRKASDGESGTEIETEVESEVETEAEEAPEETSKPSFLDAVELVIAAKKASAALLQRKLHVGYNRASCYLDVMVELGIIGEPDGAKPRDVLLSRDEWHEKLALLGLGN